MAFIIVIIVNNNHFYCPPLKRTQAHYNCLRLTQTITKLKTT